MPTEPTKKWFVEKNSWRGPGSRFWRVRDNTRDLDLNAVWSGNGRLTEVTLPLQGNGVPIDQRVVLTYQGSSGLYRGSVHDDQLLILLEVKDSTPRTIRGILYNLNEGPVVTVKDEPITDPEPIGIWGAEERDGNEWPLET